VVILGDQAVALHVRQTPVFIEDLLLIDCYLTLIHSLVEKPSLVAVAAFLFLCSTKSTVATFLMSDIDLPCFSLQALLLVLPSLAMRDRNIEFLGLQGTHKCHQVQLPTPNSLLLTELPKTKPYD